MPGKYELKKTAKGHFMFNLKAGNHQTILTSEQYNSKPAASNGIESVRKNSPIDARYERKQAKDGQHFFVLKAANHEVIGRSELYKAKSSMEKGIKSVKKNGPTAKVDDKTA